MLIAISAGMSPAVAHHSYVMFDRSKTMTLNGTVAKIDWTEPHAHFWFYVPNDKGDYDLYSFEAGGLVGLVRMGWTKATLKVGDKVTVMFHPLRDGRNGGLFLEATLSDGRKTPHERTDATFSSQ
jgi:hypothetical protein